MGAALGGVVGEGGGGGGLLRAHFLQICILAMHQNGRDTHVRQVCLCEREWGGEGRRDNGVVLFLFVYVRALPLLCACIDSSSGITPPPTPERGLDHPTRPMQTPNPNNNRPKSTAPASPSRPWPPTHGTAPRGPRERRRPCRRRRPRPPQEQPPRRRRRTRCPSSPRWSLRSSRRCGSERGSSRGVCVHVLLWCVDKPMKKSLRGLVFMTLLFALLSNQAERIDSSIDRSISIEN